METLKTIMSIFGAVVVALAMTGCGVSYGDFRAGTPGYLKELKNIEHPINYRD